MSTEIEILGKNVKELLDRQNESDRIAGLNQKALDNLIGRSMDISFSVPEYKGIEGIIKKSLFDNERDIQRFLRKEISGDLILQTKAVGDISLGNVTGGTGSISTFLPKIIQNANRKQHLGELLPRVNITGDLVYLKENGAGEGSITAVAEGATKPQRDFDLAETPALAQYVAGYARVSRRFLTSVPGATEFLTQRLVEAYLIAEDNLLLNGTGVAPELKGINVAGNFTAATSLAVAADYTQIVLSIGQLAALERNPDLVILHPDNFYSLLVNVASGSGEYTQPGVVQLSPDGQTMRIAGVPVVVSTAQTVGTFTVVDRSGLLIGVADALNVRFFEQDQNNVIVNKVTIRVESSIALAVFASNYVVTGAF